MNTSETVKKEMILFAPYNSGYCQRVAEGFRSLDFVVDSYDDRPGSSVFIKSLVKANRKFASGITRRYLKKIFEKTKGKKIDIVLIIDGLSFTKKHISLLKKQYPNATFIYYLWDSIRNYPYSLKLAECFQKKGTFDIEESKKFPGFHFLPLFFSSEFEQTQIQPEKKYDFCYIGTAHPSKLKYIEKISSELQNKGYKGFVYNYIPSKLLFFLFKAKGGPFSKKHLKDFHYSLLPYQTVSQVFAQSGMVIDATPKGQTGLTMRCIETLGARQKLITTNPYIKEYDFYRPENVYLAIEGAIDFNDSFFHVDYSPIPDEIYQKYSLQNWCKNILSF
jgi:hypothetical protein